MAISATRSTNTYSISLDAIHELGISYETVVQRHGCASRAKICFRRLRGCRYDTWRNVDGVKGVNGEGIAGLVPLDSEARFTMESCSLGTHFLAKRPVGSDVI